MSRIQRLMKLHRLMDPVGDNGEQQGGASGTGGDAGGAAGGTGTDAGAGDDKGAGDAQGKDGDKDADGKGKGGISDADAKLLRDVMKHKDRARTLETELQKATDALKNFDGIDPVKMRELLRQQEEAEVKAAEARGEYDRLIKQMGERHQEEKNRLSGDLSARDAEVSALRQQVADLTVGSAFGSSQFVAQDLTLTPAKARVIYGAHFEFKDGKVVGYDKPAGASDRTVLVDSVGDPLFFDAALAALVNKDPDRDQLLRSKAKTGAGSSTSTKQASKAVAETQKPNLSGMEKISAGLKALGKK